MKSLSNYIQEGVLDPNNINTMDAAALHVEMEQFAGAPEIKENTRSNTTHIYWNFKVEKQFKKYQKSLEQGYINAISRSPRYDDERDRQYDIKAWQNDPYTFSDITLSLDQFGTCPPTVMISFTGYDPKVTNSTDGYKGIWHDTAIAISIPNPERKHFKTEELLNIGYSILSKIKHKTSKFMKYVSAHWCVVNEYVPYNEFIKI